MSQTPDVSFVIAAYNTSETIGRAIASALAQRDVSVEVLVVDDASSDDTRDVVGRLADRFGRRRLIVWSAFALAAVTLVAVTATSLEQLILCYGGAALRGLRRCPRRSRCRHGGPAPRDDYGRSDHSSQQRAGAHPPNA